MTKTCFKCGAAKPLAGFYPHAKMRDGHLNKCKECTRRDVSTNYRAHLEHYQTYERERFNRPERREQRQQYQRTRRTKHPEKYKANIKVKRAIEAGKLSPQPCTICASTDKVEAHHPDYSKPLDVVWLCFAHHRNQHGQMLNELQSQQ